MSNLQTYYHFKLDFQKLTNIQGGGGGGGGGGGAVVNPRHQDNQLQSMI